MMGTTSLLNKISNARSEYIAVKMSYNFNIFRY